MYRGTVLEINEGKKVARCKMGDGDDSWLPFGYIHKLTYPGDKEIN